MTRIICPPFGIEARGGVLVACSPRADFPTEVDRLLLGVAANQVAILLDRRRTEDALRESEERFRGTFENAGVGIADCDVQGRFLHVNQKLCEIVGYTREELLQKTGQDITHPDDLAACLEQFLPLQRGEQPGYSLEKRSSARMARWSGSTRPSRSGATRRVRPLPSSPSCKTSPNANGWSRS